MGAATKGVGLSVWRAKGGEWEACDCLLSARLAKTAVCFAPCTLRTTESSDDGGKMKVEVKLTSLWLSRAVVTRIDLRLHVSLTLTSP